jgi:tRNA/tmRNA/rRNA uracil-C5-methylase (TrmA/RlmC/RlmD family)
MSTSAEARSETDVTTNETVAGDLLELEIGAPAHGGACVARGPDGRVVFVRHTLPGERVRARVTSAKRSHLFADAVEILRGSPDRVDAPCSYAHPGGCGGCDLQHASLPAQRAWKATVVVEQLARLAGVEMPVEVVGLPDTDPEAPGLGWRTKVSYAVDRSGQIGLHPYHSRTVLPVQTCLLAHPTVREEPVLSRRWPRASGVEVAAGALPKQVRVTERHARGTRIVGPRALTERAVGHRFEVHGFWQVHPQAADTLAAAVLELAAVQPGERALDLYAGAGLFAVALADAGAEVIAVEGDRQATVDAVANVKRLPVEVWHGPVGEALDELGAEASAETRPDVVVLDPPRVGAGAEIVGKIAALQARAVVYVACDPAALARDVATFATAGYSLTGLRAFDCFPMTHHVECVALLERSTN